MPPFGILRTIGRTLKSVPAIQRVQKKAQEFTSRIGRFLTEEKILPDLLPAAKEIGRAAAEELITPTPAKPIVREIRRRRIAALPKERTVAEAGRLAKEVSALPALTRTGISFGQEIKKQVTGKEPKPFRPKGGLGRFLLEPSKDFRGVEPITTRQERLSRSTEKFAQSIGATPEQAARLKFGVTALGFPLLSAIETVPGAGPGKKVAKELMEEAIKKLGKEAAERLAREGGETVIKQSLKQISEAEKIGVIKGIGEGLKPPTEVAERALVANIRLDKLQTTDDVKDLIKRTAEDFAPQIEEARRGTISLETTREIADNLGMSYENLLKRRKGQAFNAEEGLAARDLLVNSGEEVKRLTQEVLESDSDEVLARFTEALNRHANIQAQVSGVTAEAGRALSAFRIPAEASDEVLKTAIESFGGREFTKDTAQRMAALTKRAEETGDLRPLWKFVQSSQNPSFKDKAYEWWLNSILSNPVTHEVNTISNISMLAKLGAERTVQAGIELVRGGKRDVTFGEAGHFIFGMLRGLQDGVGRATRVMQYGPTLEQLGKLDIRSAPKIRGKLGEVVRTPTKALVAEDEFFKAIAGTGELNAQAYRMAWKEGERGKALNQRIAEILEDPPDEMMQRVKRTELEATFQTQLGEIASTVVRARNKIPFLKYVIPFVKTPTNIFKEALKSSPVGVAKILKEIRSGASSEELTRQFSKTVLGSALSAGIVMAFLNDRITGSVPSDKNEREAFYRQGKKPISIRIGDHWVSLARIEPFATVAGLTADTMKKIDEGENVTDSVISIIDTLGEQVKDKTFFQGLGDIIKGITGEKGEKAFYWKKLLISAITGFEPQFFGQFARAVDPTFRDVKDDKFFDQLIKGIKVKTPWLSKSVPPILDVFGEEAKREGGFVERLLTPFQRGKATQDPVELELQRLELTPGLPARTRQVGKIKGKLDIDTYKQFVKDTGQIGHARLVQLIEDPIYAQLDDEDKSKIIGDVLKKTRSQVKELKIGELLLSIARVDFTENKAVMNPFNDFMATAIKTNDWTQMSEDDKLKFLLDIYAEFEIKFGGRGTPKPLDERQIQEAEDLTRPSSPSPSPVETGSSPVPTGGPLRPL